MSGRLAGRLPNSCTRLPHLLASVLLLLVPGAANAGDRLLFLTASSVEELSGVERRMHAPTPRGIVFRLDAPWEGPEGGYVSVMADEDRFRMYYRGGGELGREQTCVAFSADGVRWERPTLGLFEFAGSRANNIVWMPERKSYAESHNFFAFRDSAPGIADDARWKAVALAYHRNEAGEPARMLATLASPDGLRWRRLSQEPAIREGGGFDSLNIAFRDPWSGNFRAYCRVGVQGFRFIGHSESPDFSVWSPLSPVQFEPFPATQFYTNGVLPMPTLRPDDGGAWYIGMPMRFVPARRSAMGRDTDGLSDAVLIASRDGLGWEFVSAEAWLRPGTNPDNWGHAHSSMTPAHGILQTAPGEWSVYWSVFEGETLALQRGTLRPEGFASLHASAARGSAVTAPIAAAGCRLLLNASTSAVGSIRVGLLDARGNEVPGFGIEDCEPLWGDGLFLPVTWKGGSVVPDSTAGTGPLRLRVELHDADLFAVRCQPAG